MPKKKKKPKTEKVQSSENEGIVVVTSNILPFGHTQLLELRNESMEKK